MAEKQQVFIFDTTLRDGQQCPGAGMSFSENLEYARLAALLGIDIVEAGFPAASALDFEIVNAIAKEYGSSEAAPIVTALCQLRDEQIDRTIEAIQPAVRNKRARLHVYVPVDPTLMAASLGEKADKKQIERDVSDFVRRAAATGLEVEFSPEGYSRMGENFDFTTDLICAAVESGASIINCPDTIGGSCQYEGEDYYVQYMNRHAEIVKERFPGRETVWSVHCHNDFGLAVQNSINGVAQGPARQIEGCINGVGERAGNAAIEQVVLIIEAFGSQLRPDCDLYTSVKSEYLAEMCSFVSKKMLPQQPHSPVSGANAARHSSGGHTNAVLNNPLAYQPFDPRKIGGKISLAFGPLSGGNHVKSIITAAGYLCSDDEKAEVAQFIKSLYSERRKGITDEELLSGYFAYRAPVKIEEFDYSRSKNRSKIELQGVFFGKSGAIEREHEGKDSALAALKSAIDAHFSCSIESHQSQSEGSGINAISVSTILIMAGEGQLFNGVGKDQDIEISAMKALISAVNQAYIEFNFRIENTA